MSGIHLVIDLDETLVGAKDGKVFARPFLKEFLAFCFTHSASVSIWTAATIHWWNMCYQGIMQPLMKPEWKFAHVLTDKDCKVAQYGGFYGLAYGNVQVTKPLMKLWTIDANMKPENTIMIDDKDTGSDNSKNFIQIDEFKVTEEAMRDDIALLEMIGRLQQIMDLHKKTENVQKIHLNSDTDICIYTE